MVKLSRYQPNKTRKFRSYLLSHVRTLVGSLGKLYQSPGSSSMTIAVVAIALALPAGFYTILENAQQLSQHWNHSASLSLYLKTSTSEEDGRQLAAKLRTNPDINEVVYISREQSLADFRTYSGFGEALDILETNPLPAVITVIPTLTAEAPLRLNQLQQIFSALPEVEIVQLDLQWVRRLMAIINVVQRGLLIVAFMLALAVMLVIGNTIRLDIQNRQREIQVQKLIGATNAFIRRPFLYTGFWYGLLGGSAAWLLVTLNLIVLNDPIKQLSYLYQSHFELRYLSGCMGFSVIATSITLGIIGSWIAVSRRLKEIEPGQ